MKRISIMLVPRLQCVLFFHAPLIGDLVYAFGPGNKVPLAREGSGVFPEAVDR